MLEPTNVTINSRNYTVNPFSPIEAYEYHHARLKAYRTGESMFALGMKAIAQCLTDMLDELSDKSAFKKHFTQYPEDLLPLQEAAIGALLGPFWPSEKSTSENDANS